MIHLPEEVLTLVKVPIADVEEWIRTKHVLPRILTDFRIDNNNLLLYFGEEPLPPSQRDSPSLQNTDRRRRRAHRKRNRMKTRGWQIIARMINSKGQKCTIYGPFVDVLRDTKLNPEERKAAVEKILRLNKNRPSEASIRYFLENTLEYLANQQNQTSSKEMVSG